MRRNKNGLPKHCAFNVDRHGKRRVRFRKGGFSTYLTGIPWSEDFMRQYAAALEGVKAQALNIGAKRIVTGSVNALVTAYLDCSQGSSSPFKTAAYATQRTRRNILEKFREAHGELALFSTDARGNRTMLLKREHVQVMANKKAATPFARRNFLNTLRALFKWAKAEGRVPDDPTLGVKREKTRTDGYAPWTEEQIAAFEAYYPATTTARRAFGLLLFTGQRVGDVVRMGPQHLHAAAPGMPWKSTLIITQAKTGMPVNIPVHPKLQEILDAAPSGHLNFLVTSRGEPYTPANFSNWFCRLCLQAGCRGVSAHGLRKATGTTLADLKCTTHEIAAVLGHKSLAMAELYTRTSDRRKLAQSAMRKLIAGKR